MFKIFKTGLVALGIVSFCIPKSYSQTEVAEIAEMFTSKIYVSQQNDTLQYRLLMPIDYDASKQYPLVLCLSGGAGRGTDNMKQIMGSKAAQVLSTLENRKKHPAFILVPQCPPGSDWGRTLGEIEREFLIEHGKYNRPNVGSLVFETINVLEQEFNIDATRRYIIGQSMGGYGSWHFILSHPQMFAAAIPICGGANPDLAKNIVDMPLWVFHGDDDKTVPVSFSRSMIEAITREGGSPIYKEFPNVGHSSWHPALETPGLFDWLFAQINEKETRKN